MNSPNRWLVFAFITALSAPCLWGCAGNRDSHPVPLVTVVCEARGMSPEEVESLVTSTVESSLHGMAGVQGQSSASRSGQAVIWMQFDPGMDLHQARQQVAERLEGVELPSGVEASLAPPSCHEFLIVALRREATSEAGPHDERALELRDLAEYSLRRRLLAIPDVSQVTVIGGSQLEHQVVVSPEHLQAYGVTLRELAHAISAEHATPDVPDAADETEITPPSVGKSRSLAHIETIVIGTRSGRPVLVRDVAHMRTRCVADLPAGDPTIGQLRNAAVEAAVMLAIELAPNADKFTASERIDEVLQQQTEDLPRGVVIERKIDQRLDTMVSHTLQKLRRDLPPDKPLIRRSSERSGDFIVTAPDDRITIKVFGPDLAVLHATAEEMRGRMLKLAGAVDLQVEPQRDEPRLEYEVDRQRADQLGLTVDALDESASLAIGGEVVTQVHSGNRTADLVIKISQSDVERQRILDTPIRCPSGELVPLSLLVDFHLVSGPAAIYHENMQRMVLVSCAVEGRDKSEVESDIRRALESTLSDTGDSYHVEYGKR